MRDMNSVPPGDDKEPQDDDTTGHEIVVQCLNEIEWAFEERMVDKADMQSSLNEIRGFVERMVETYKNTIV